MNVRCAKLLAITAAILFAIGLPGFVERALAATPTFVQLNAHGITGGIVDQASFPAANKAGNLIVAYVIRPAGANVIVSDTRGNVYQSATGPLVWKSGVRSAEVFYAKNIAAGSNTVTATFSSSVAPSGLLYILEYAGLDTVAPLDAVAAAIGSSTAMDSGTTATTGATDLIIGVAASSNSVTSTGTGFTSRSTLSGNRVEDKVVTVSGSYNATASQNGTAWAMQMVAFKAAITVVPSIASFSATPASIQVGQSANLAWVVSGIPTPTVSINNGVGTVSGTTVAVAPTKTTAYTLTATNSTGTATAKVTVTVTPVPTPPSVPTLLKATTISASEIDLSWKASTPGNGGAVAGYKIFRNGAQVATTAAITYADVGLSASTLYSYTVAAFDGAGVTSAQSAAVSATTKSVPPAVTSFSATPAAINAGQSTTLAWTVSGSPVPMVSINNGIGAVAGTSVSAAPTQTMTYTLTATNSAGTATAQTTVTVTAVSPPSAPAGLGATAISASEIDLSWTASTPGSGGAIAGYKIFRNGSQVATTAALAYADTVLSVNTLYSYTVAAFDGAGLTSAQSAMVSATTKAISPSVTSFSAAPPAITAGQSTMLAWVVAGTPAPTVSINNGVGAVVGTTVSVSPTQTTTYTLSATNIGGTATAQTTVTVTPVTPPSVPTGLGASVISASEIDLSWTASTPGSGGAVAGYKVFRNSSQVGTATGTTYADIGLSASTGYSYTVAAFDGTGITSAPSAAVSATTNAAPVAASVSSFSATPTVVTAGQSVNLAWAVSGTPAPSVSINNGVGAVTGPSVSVAPTQTTTYTLTATNSGGTATAQATVTVTPTPPAIPTGVGTTVVSSSEIDLSWTASTPGSGGTVAGYKIFRNGSQVGTATGASYPDTGLSAKTGYSYTVAAFDVVGTTSAPSTAVSATTNAAPVAPSVTSFSAAPAAITAGQSTTLNWSVSGTPAPTLSIDKGVGVVTGTSVSISPTQTTTYTLTATNSTGSATAQTSVTVTPTAPSVPTGLGAIVVSASEIDLSWNVSNPGSGSAVTGYKIFRNGSQVGAATGTSYADTGLSAATGYSYAVAAFDGAGITSAPSAAVSATTASVSPSIGSFSATPASITAGQPATLAWSVSGSPAPVLSIDNGVGALTGASMSVTPATTTTYTLTATNSAGSITAQTTVTVTPAVAPPSVPAGLGATAVSASEIDLAWNASTPGDRGIVGGYKVYRDGSQVGTATGASYFDIGLGANTSHAYAVAAFDDLGNTSAPSSAVSAATPPAPVSPSVISFSGSPAAINVGQLSTLAWSVSGYPVPTLSIDNGVGAVTGTSTPAAPTQTTTYTITATNNSGTATAQATVTVNIPVIPPSIPAGVAASTISTSEIDISWSASTAGNGGPVAGYRIYRNGSPADSAATTSFADTGLGAATSYSYGVAAVDVSGNISAPSPAVSATTSAIPPSVDSFSATPPSINAGQSTTLAWVVSANPAPTVSISGIGTVTGTSTSVAPAQTTTYTLTATNSAGTVSAQATVSVLATPPSVPTGLKATVVSAFEIDLSWNASTPGSGGAVGGYKIYRNGSPLATTTGFSYADLGLSANTNYSYTVAAFDGAGITSAQSTAVPATTGAAPVSPSVNSFTATPAGITAGQSTTLAWSVSGNPAPTVSINNGIGAVTGTSVSVSPTQTTTYTLTATNSGGTITAQATVSVTPTPPSVPTGLKASVISASEIDLSWNASTPGSGGAIGGYKIYRNGSQIGVTSATSYADIGLAASTTYSYGVAAYDAAGTTSALSAASPATTNAPSIPPAVNSFTATPLSITSGQSTTLAWSVSGNPAPTLTISGVGALTGTSTSVSPAQTTTYMLTATNSAGTAGAQVTVTVTPTPPSVPTGLGATVVSASEIDLAWSASMPGSGGAVAGYKIYRNGSPAGTATGIAYADTGLTASTTYSYTVAAFDGVGTTSSPSAAVPATTRMGNVAPAVNSFSATPSSITSGTSSTLAWSVSGNPAPTVSISGVGMVTGTSASVAPTQTTIYMLTATNSTGTAGAQVTVTIIPPGTLPSIPAGLSANPFSNSEIDLSWNASIPGSGGVVAGYKIYRNGSQVGTSALTSYADLGLSASTSYSYAVAAFDAGGVTSAQSIVVPATTKPDPNTVPVDALIAMNTGTPGTMITTSTMIAGTVGTNQWTTGNAPVTSMAIAPSMNKRLVPVAVNGVSYPTTYPSQAVAYDDSQTVQTFQDNIPSGHRQVTVAGYITLGPTPAGGNSKLFDYWLVGGVTGQYAVMQLFDQGSGTGSTYAFNIETHPGNVTTHSPYIPVTPGATYWCVLRADFTSGVSQLAVYSVPAFTQVGYVVGTQGTGQDVKEISIGNNEAGVAPGTQSIFENIIIDYTNAAFPLGLPGGSHDITPPSTPTGLSGTAVSSTEIDLTWNASTDDVGVLGYDIFRNGVKVGTSITPAYHDSGLIASTMYSYSVSAYDPTGNVSTPSLPVNATTQPIRPINLVQHGGMDCGTATTCALHFASNTTAGNMIVVGLRVGHALGGVIIADTDGNTYVQAVTKANPNDVHQLYLYYAQNVVGGADTVTVTVNAASPTLRVAALEYSGAAPSGALDQVGSAVGKGTAVSSGNVTTTAPIELVVGVATNANGVSWTAGSGFSLHDAPSNKLADEDEVVFSTGTSAAAFTLSSSDTWTAVAATFKPQ